MATLSTIRGLVDSAVTAGFTSTTGAAAGGGGGGGGGSGVTSYANLAALPAAAPSNEGNLAYLTDVNKVYVSIGTAWFPLAVVNQNPTLTVSPDGVIQLATDTTPTVVRLISTDADSNATLSFSVESDGNFSGLGTISQDSSIFTITPRNEAGATTTQSQLTFRVSDGSAIVSSQRTLRLIFGAGGATYPTITETSLGTAGNANGGGTNVAVSRAGGVMAIANYYQPNQYGSFGWYQLVNGTWTYRSHTGGFSGISGNTSSYYGTGGYGLACSRNYIFATYGSPQNSTHSKPFGWHIDGSTLSQLSYSAFSPPSSISGQSSYTTGAPVACDSSGTHVLYGMGADNGNGSGSGKVTYYKKNSGAGHTWAEIQSFPSPQAGTSNAFGNHIRMTQDGLYAIIAEKQAEGPAPFTTQQYGKAHVFTRDSANDPEWTLQQSLQPQPNEYGNSLLTEAQATNGGWSAVPDVTTTHSPYIGWTVDIDDAGETVILGAPNLSSKFSGSDYVVGGAFVYKRTGTTWNFDQFLHPVMMHGKGSGGNYNYQAHSGYFGTIVCINGPGNTIWVGSPFDPNYKTAGRTGQGGSGMFFSKDSDGGPFVARNWTEGASNNSYGYAYGSLGSYGITQFVSDHGVAAAPHYNTSNNFLYDSS